jgi:serine/threonine-protein kinase
MTGLARASRGVGDRVTLFGENTVIASKYRLVRELASGGMGAVWVAHHLQLDTPVAVKFMSPSLRRLSDARARFAREAVAAARLRGPNVVEVLDHGVDGNVPYIVMELLEGEHLGDRLRRERRLSVHEAAAIAEQVGRALGRAHAAGIVHRDLKPANVFLSRVDGEQIVKILDFGIHKAMHEEGEASRDDVLMGSPQYMSPEQARGGRAVDHRADLWSLAAILYRSVTGVPAFDGVSGVDVIVQVCTGPLPVATKAAPDLPPAMDAFFHKALAREPEQRFASAREMTSAFSALARPAESSVKSTPRPGAGAREAKIQAVPTRRAQIDAASPAEIDAFVEGAFHAIVRPGATGDDAPPTTRCAPGKSGVRERPAGEARARTEVNALIDEGFLALRRGEPETARRAWSEALGLDPKNRTLAVNLRRLEAVGSAR